MTRKVPGTVRSRHTPVQNRVPDPGIKGRAEDCKGLMLPAFCPEHSLATKADPKGVSGQLPQPAVTRRLHHRIYWEKRCNRES